MRKPLTYGGASLHPNRRRNPPEWRELCYTLNEKPEAQFYEKGGEVYCEYREGKHTRTVKVYVKFRKW